MKKTVKGIIDSVVNNSSWSRKTINNAVINLGYDPNDKELSSFEELSCTLKECAQHGAGAGWPGFSYYTDTVEFYRRNKNDIVNNLESMAEDMGEDIFSMIKGFGIFKNGGAPSNREIGKALYSEKICDDLTELYNVFAWFTLEEIARAYDGLTEE